MLLPYPTQAQFEEALPILFSEVIRSDPAPLADSVQAAYIVLGYGLSIGIPVPAVSPLTMPLSEARKLIAGHPATRGGPFNNLPWQQIIALVLAVIQAWRHPTPPPAPAV